MYLSQSAFFSRFHLLTTLLQAYADFFQIMNLSNVSIPKYGRGSTKQKRRISINGFNIEETADIMFRNVQRRKKSRVDVVKKMMLYEIASGKCILLSFVSFHNVIDLPVMLVFEICNVCSSVTSTA